MEIRPLISVIIPARNEGKYLENTLKSLKKQTYHNLEIIVADSASTDNTAEIARQYTNNVYRSEKRAAKARNLGARKAKGDILVFLDADTTAASNLLEKAKESIDKGYIGGKAKILPEKENLVSNLFWFSDNLIDKILFYKFGISNICSYTPFVFCKKEDFESIGGFDEDVVATEEIRVLRKLMKRGKIKFINDSYVKTSGRRAAKEGFLYGGLLVPLYHFFFPTSKKLPYRDVR